MIGEHCSATCPTKDHETFGACIRGKGLRVAWAASSRGLDLSLHKRQEAELDAYQAARRQGIQPAGTSLTQVRAAVEASNKTGVAFDAGR